MAWLNKLQNIHCTTLNVVNIEAVGNNYNGHLSHQYSYASTLPVIHFMLNTTSTQRTTLNVLRQCLH
jgi:hypothetical protein